MRIELNQSDEQEIAMDEYKRLYSPERYQHENYSKAPFVKEDFEIPNSDQILAPLISAQHLHEEMEIKQEKPQVVEMQVRGLSRQ